MSPSPARPWPPTKFERFIRGHDTSMGTALIMTDAGEAYVKALGNRQGPQPLACEWVGTGLARWLGLTTFDTAILTLEPSDEIPFVRGGRAAAGPAFAARKVKGAPWSGRAADLRRLENPEAISRLVVFDNWVLNCDRYPPDLSTRKPNRDNVFLATEGVSRGKRLLYGMDHTHCFTCGRDLSARMADIDRERDDRLYGLFPEFVPYLRRDELDSCRRRLREFDRATIRELIEQVPGEWEVPSSAVGPWQELVFRRAGFVAEAVIGTLLARCP